MPETQAKQSRAHAFAAATRHSGRVRLARRALIFGVGGVVILLGVLAFFDPFHPLPKGASIEKIGLDGTKVTIEKPRLTGFRQDGRAYSVTATSGVQDIREPNILSLSNIVAHIAMADKSNADVTAPKGTYDAKKDRMELSGAIQLRNDVGYDLKMQEAVMNFKAGVLRSSKPVELVGRSGSVHADSMEVVDNGKRISFSGNVQSVMLPEDASSSPDRTK